jgi:hypothetical protein
MTKYNQYYYTQYTKWLNEVDFLVKSLNEYKIHEGVLSSHQQLANGVFKVTYSNGVEVILNYTERVITENLATYGIIRGNLVDTIDLGLDLQKEIYENVDVINNIINGSIRNQIIIKRTGGDH